MTIEAYLRLEGIEGESTSADHRGEIELVSWSWGVTGAPEVPLGAASGKASPDAFTFTHRFDKASPVLLKLCALGRHVSMAQISSVRSGQGKKDFLRIALREVFITSIQPQFSAGGEIFEVISIRFSDIEVSYKPTTETGALGGEVRFGWSIKDGKAR